MRTSRDLPCASKGDLHCVLTEEQRVQVPTNKGHEATKKGREHLTKGRGGTDEGSAQGQKQGGGKGGARVPTLPHLGLSSTSRRMQIGRGPCQLARRPLPPAATHPSSPRWSRRRACWRRPHPRAGRPPWPAGTGCAWPRFGGGLRTQHAQTHHVHSALEEGPGCACECVHELCLM